MVHVLWAAYKGHLLCNIGKRGIMMKKEAAMVIGIIFLAILAGSCAQQEALVEKTAENSFEDIPEVAEAPELAPDSPPAEEIKEEQPVVEEPVITDPDPVVEKEGFQIFNPVLTYPGAYNGPLYGTSEQVGSASMDSYFENLDRNGINFFIGMFGISGEPSADALVSDQGLGEVIDAARKHPYRVIPFFNPGIGGEEVEQYLGEILLGWYAKTLAASQRIAGNDFIRGFGEVETQEWKARHNDPKVIELIELAEDNSINFMFHPVASKIDDV